MVTGPAGTWLGTMGDVVCDVGDLDAAVGVAPQLPDCQAAVVERQQRRQDHCPQPLVLAQGLGLVQEHQRLQCVDLAGHRPDQDLQLCVGQVSADATLDPAAVVHPSVQADNPGSLLQGCDATPQEVPQNHHRCQAARRQVLDPIQHWVELRWQLRLSLPAVAVEEGLPGRQLKAVVGVGHGHDPVGAPVLPLGAGEGTDVGAGHPVPQLEVVGADDAPTPPKPDEGIIMPEDGDAGADPHEHLHEVDEDRHQEDGVGGEVLQLKPELLQQQEEEGGDRGHQPAADEGVEEDKLPHDQVAEGN